MDRQDSFSSCVSDSEGDVDSFAGSYTNLSVGEIKGNRSCSPASLSTGSGQLSVRSATPQGKDRFHRRSGTKRQAPQPPSRPPATTTPSPITTVHLQFEPSMAPPADSTPSGQSMKITRIVSEPVAIDPLLPPSSSAEQVRSQREVQRPTVPSQYVPYTRALSPDRPMSPHRQNISIQPVEHYSRPTDRIVMAGQPMSMSPPQQQVFKGQPKISRPMSPTRPMSPPRAMSPPPSSLSTTTPMIDPQIYRGGPLALVQSQSRPPMSSLQTKQMTPQRRDMVTPVSPTQPMPQVPVRSASSAAAARGINNARIRLIDEESDSEAYQSDATEDLRTPLSTQFIQRISSTAVYPAAYQPQVHPNVPSESLPLHPRDIMTAQQENYDYYSSFDESPSQSEVGSESSSITATVSDNLVMRGRARRLAHSSSDPGMARPQRLLHVQHPRAPGVAVPPPLDQLSEEDTAAQSDDTEDMRQEDEIVGPGLKRTDSMVTVAHLYEDVLVSSRLRVRVTLTNLTVVVVVAALVLPNTAIMLYTAFRLVFGTLFPAYYSYKAVKTKNVKEYVKWMMYWIVFAFFTCFETFTDLFLSFWFPFYYELKILVVLWLLSPATRGSSILYRKFVHPWLTRREDDIDNCIAQAKQQGYSTVIQLGTKGVNYATTVLMQTAIKASLGQQGGGGIVNQLRRSYSSGELSDGGDMNRNVKALPHIPDDGFDDRNHSSGSGPYESESRMRAESDGAYRSRGSSVSRGIRSNKTRSADVTDYYQDVSDDTIQRRRSPRTQDSASLVLSADDLTSGYSSGDPDAGDLICDLRHDPIPVNQLEIIPEPKKTSKVRRTQSLSASTLNNHRSQRVVSRRGEGREGMRSGSAGRGSGPVDDLGAPASYSSSGHPAAAPHHGSSFKRSRPGEISAYATLPRASSKRTTTAAAAKKRQV